MYALMISLAVRRSEGEVSDKHDSFTLQGPVEGLILDYYVGEIYIIVLRLFMVSIGYFAFVVPSK
jgi:hypothetical protein